MPLDPFRPFTTSQARAAGITKAQLAGPAYRPLLGTVWISADVPHHRSQRTAAALLVHPPGAVASHTSAAALIGAPVPADPEEHVTVSRPELRRPRHGVRCHVAALRTDEIQVVERLRCSAPHRMFSELASQLPLVDLVVVGDWLVRQRLVTCASLVAHCRASRDRHARHARRAAAYVRDRVDSPMETRLRMLLVLAGLPEPTVNHALRDENGTVLVRLDLSWPEIRLAVEYDGRHHVERQSQWESDLHRREGLDGIQWRTLVVTARDVYREPGRLVLRVWEALRQRGYRPLQPPSDGWRPHFER